MNVLRSSIFRRIYRTEIMIMLLMLTLPVTILFMQIRQEQLLRYLLPVAAIFTTLRMLMIISLANYLAEASVASHYFNKAKNWFLMHCAIEVVALMLNVSTIAMKNTVLQSQQTRYILMIAGYLVYLTAHQLSSCIAKNRLLRGFGAVWYLCGGDPAQEKGIRLTFILQIISSVLYAGLMVCITLYPSLFLIAYGLASTVVIMVLIVQLRITMHARKTALLLATLSE